MLINRLGDIVKKDYEAKKIADSNKNWVNKKPRKKQAKNHPWRSQIPQNK